MTATPFDQVTMLRRTSPRIDRDGSDPLRNDARSGDYRRRNGSTAYDAEGLASDADVPLRPLPASSADPALRRCGPPSFLASVVDIAPVLPTVGTIATIFAYVGGPTPLAGQASQIPLIIGVTSTLILGLVTACLHRVLFTTPEQAHPRSFSELRQRVDSLAAQLDVLVAEITPETLASQRLAFGEAVAHCRTLQQDLARGGPQWIVGTGYVDAITRLHRAEEALIAVQPATDVLAGALFDELRIAGSTMADRDNLLGKLRAAVQSLRPSTDVNEPTAARRQQAGGSQLTAVAPAEAAPAARPGCDALWAEAEARIVLCGVRRALNDFRDESRARLIRSRSRLLGTMTMTGVITYVLLAFAVNLDGAHDSAVANPIIAAAAIYLVGAVVGLFNRLHVESGDDAAGEDYGLSKTRLLLTPMLSGIAAVGGVLITGMLSGIVDLNAITPTAGTVVSKAVGLSPHEIFNLKAYPFALVLAAIFGLTPGTFLKRLHQATEQSKLNLKSTAAHQQVTGGQGGRSGSARA